MMKFYFYSPRANAIQWLELCIISVLVVAAIFLYTTTSGIVTKYILPILFGILVICCVVALNKVSDKIAEKDTQKNITTKARYAYLYCKEHPEAYASLVTVNTAFTEKYVCNEVGKIVQRK